MSRRPYRYPWRRCSALAAISLLLAALAACAGPKAPERVTFSTSGTAIVRGGDAEGFYLFGRGTVTITRVDDTDLVDRDNKPLYRTVEVYAGLHTVRFLYEHAALCFASETACVMRMRRTGRLTFDARPGHVYRVAAAYRKASLRAWIVDENTNRRVAGDASGAPNWAAGGQPFGYVTQF